MCLFLQSCSPTPVPSATELVTYIFPRNKEVDAKNTEELAKIPGEATVYEAVDTIFEAQPSPRPADGQPPPAAATPAWKRDYFQDIPAAKRIELKVGAQVMLLRNYTRLDLDKLACYISPNGVQHDVPVLDDDTPTFGEDAEARRRLEHEILLFNGSVGHVESFNMPDAKNKKNKKPGSPVIVFPRPGFPSIRVALERVEWEVKDHPKGPRLALRLQYPLRLCYAITVHKSQSATITCKMVTDLGVSVFAPGQAYVALSRICSADQLYLLSFTPDAIKAHPRALQFYASLS